MLTVICAALAACGTRRKRERPISAATGEKRRVDITGEAYFEVAKNAAMPFVVGSNEMEVQGKDGTQLVGTNARNKAIIEPERVAMLFKRGMGEKTFLPDEQPFTVDGKTWSPEELSASVLKKLAQMAEDRFGEPARKVVITVPAYFGDNERAATKSAGEIAGLEVVHVVNEPTAAAVAHGLDNASTGRI